MPSPEQQPAWKSLSRLATDVARMPVAELLTDEDRNTALRVSAPGLALDFSKQRLNREVLDLSLIHI